MALLSSLTFKSTAVLPKLSIQPISSKTAISAIIPKTVVVPTATAGSLVAFKPINASAAIKSVLKPNVLVKSPLALVSTNRFPIADMIKPLRLIRIKPLAPLITVTTTKSRSDRDNDQKAFSQRFETLNKKFSPYENLTGLSSQRPELMLLTEFKPIFNDNFDKQSVSNFTGKDFVSGLNDYGDFIDIQLQVKNLYHYNIAKSIKELKEKDEEIKKDLEDREAAFLEAMEATIRNVNSLYDLSKALDANKDSFNLKSDKFNISWETIVRNYFYDYYSWFVPYLGVSKNFMQMTPSHFLTKFGYQAPGIVNFSSTKIYLQLLSEFRNLISNYSSVLLNQSIDRQKNDFKAVSINTPANNAWYDVSRNVTDIESPVYNDIARLNGRSVGAAVPRLSGFFEQIDKSFAPAFSRAEDKISFYSHFMAREFRYSVALAATDTQTFLAQTYGYTVNTQGSNFNVFDFMIGRIGTKITDAFSNASAGSNSIVSPAQIQNGDNLVLPFENKYLELDGSIFTPGSEYLVDSIFENASQPNADGSPLDVSKLETYANSTNQVANKFTEFVDRMRFFYQVPSNTFSRYNRLSFNNRSTMESPASFVELIYDSLLSGRQVPKYEIANDPMSALLNLAYKDKTLKALLYMYVIISNSGNPSVSNVGQAEIRRQINFSFGTSQFVNNDQSALDRIIQEIQARLASLVTTRFNYLYNDIFNVFGFYTSQFRPYYYTSAMQTFRDVKFGSSFNEITAENIANSLRRGSPALNFLKNTIAAIQNSFKRNSAFVDTRTRYSDINDSLVVALSMELCLTIFDTHINTRFLNRYITRGASSIGREYYTISNKQSNTGASVSLALTKISNEVDLSIQCITGITAILRKVVDSSLMIVNRVRNAETVRVLNEVIATLGDRKYLGHLMNEQQLILAKANTDEVRLKLFSKSRGADTSIGAAKARQATDDLSILDDTTISGNLRNAFYAFFAQDKFASKKSFNSRILTVGLPNGFTQSIREKIRLDKMDKNYKKAQVDVVNLTCYKIDVEYQDVIFKPQKFLFEMSRFVLKNESDIEPIGIDADMRSIIRAVPTRDYSVEIYDSVDLLNKKALEKTPLFTNPQYSFLNDDQKMKMLENHISSHFLEIYLRMLTGIATAEYNFELLLNQNDRTSDKHTIEEQFMKKLIVSRVNSRVERPVTWEEITAFGYLEAQSHKRVNIIKNDIRTIQDLARVSTAVSNPDYEATRLLRPKEFERVFHVIVDPDDFEIDVLETQKTAQGREAMAKLLKQKILIDIDENSVVTSDRAYVDKRYKIVDRLVSENNLIFEKYFTTFETVLPSTIDPNDGKAIKQDK